MTAYAFTQDQGQGHLQSQECFVRDQPYVSPLLIKEQHRVMQVLLAESQHIYRLFLASNQEVDACDSDITMDMSASIPDFAEAGFLHETMSHHLTSFCATRIRDAGLALDDAASDVSIVHAAARVLSRNRLEQLAKDWDKFRQENPGKNDIIQKASMELGVTEDMAETQQSSFDQLFLPVRMILS